VALSGREFIGCVERFHNSNCGTVRQRRITSPQNVAQPGRVYRVCEEISHRTPCYKLAERSLVVWRAIAPHNVAESGSVFSAC